MAQSHSEVEAVMAGGVTSLYKGHDSEDFLKNRKGIHIESPSVQSPFAGILSASASAPKGPEGMA